eukprot:4833858-Pyramimonas_sp.AAC.1
MGSRSSIPYLPSYLVKKLCSCLGPTVDSDREPHFVCTVVGCTTCIASFERYRARRHADVCTMTGVALR